MKAIDTLKKGMATLTGLVIAVATFSQDGPYTKNIRKEFPVTQNTRLELINQYGNVNIVNRDQPTMTIEVNVKADLRDRDRANDLLNMVHIDISQSGDVIRAETSLEQDFSKFFRGFHTGNGGLEINYTVTMPNSVPVNLSNKYGNVYVDELTSTSTLDIKYGKLTANKILHDSKEPLSKIYLSYSDGTVQEARWVELDIKYSKINITESKALAIMSKYSKVFVTQGTSVVSESKFDTYDLGKLNNFITTAQYGHFSIQELSGKLQVDTKYTDVMVNRITAGFENIKVNNSYGSYRLGIDPSASYKLNGNARYCSINYPEDNARVNRFNENNQMKVNGVVGNNSNPTAEVNLTTSYGNIRLVP